MTGATFLSVAPDDPWNEKDFDDIFWLQSVVPKLLDVVVVKHQLVDADFRHRILHASESLDH
jgi:hypothetical protein